MCDFSAQKFYATSATPYNKITSLVTKSDDYA